MTPPLPAGRGSRPADAPGATQFTVMPLERIERSGLGEANEAGFSGRDMARPGRRIGR